MGCPRAPRGRDCIGHVLPFLPLPCGRGEAALGGPTHLRGGRRSKAGTQVSRCLGRGVAGTRPDPDGSSQIQTRSSRPQPGACRRPSPPAGRRLPLPLASLGAPPPPPTQGHRAVPSPGLAHKVPPHAAAGSVPQGPSCLRSLSRPQMGTVGGGGRGQAVSAVMTPLQPWTCTCLEVQPAPRPTPSPCTAPHRARVLPQRPLALPGGGEPGREGHSSIRPSHGTPA